MAASPVDALLPLRDLDGSILLAVSGGGDSMALLHAAVEARQQVTRFPALHALTVDHALRDESAREADFVAQECVRLNVSHRTVRLDWTPPTSGLQSRARYERISTLRSVAMELGATILTGHTTDDDAETMAMRQARDDADDSEWAGIPAGLWLQPGWLLRPFLRQRRADLRLWLSSQGVSWIDDPSNEDDRFERVRVRRDLAANPEAISVLNDRAQKAGKRREAVTGDAARLIQTEFRASCEGFGVRVEHKDRIMIDGSAAMLAIRTICAHVGGVMRTPPLSMTRDALLRVRTGGPAGPPRSATLSRCLIVANDSTLHIVPEARDWGAPRVASYSVALGERNGEWRKPRRVPLQRWGAPVFHGVWVLDGLPSGADAWAANPAIYSTNPNGTVPPKVAISHQTAPHGMVHAHYGPVVEARVTARPLVRALTPYVEFVPSTDLSLAGALAMLAGRPASEVPRYLPLDSERRPFEPR